MQDRIARHRAERPRDWATVEEPLDPTGACWRLAGRVDLIVVDCLMVWVSNLLDCGREDDAVLEAADDLAALAAERRVSLVFVSNDVGEGVHPPTEIGLRFRDLLGSVNPRIAAAADCVTLRVGRHPRRDQARRLLSRAPGTSVTTPPKLLEGIGRTPQGRGLVKRALGSIHVAVIVLLLELPALAAGLTMRDQTGRALTLPAPPRRIVSLVPSVTEILYAIGAQDVLVGVTDFCDYPAEARTKPRVGGMIAPSLETIVALKPDLVVVTTAGNRDETFSQLTHLKLSVYVVNPVRLADVLDLITRLGALTGHEAEAARLTAALSARIEAVRARVAAHPRPRVLYVVWPDPLIVPARRALVSELLVLAGADSVSADGGGEYPRYSLEAAVAGAPEVIILASHSSGQGPMAREKWERFKALPAVKSGRLYTVSGDLLHRYGPRVVDGLETLARIIHPHGR